MSKFSRITQSPLPLITATCLSSLLLSACGGSDNQSYCCKVTPAPIVSSSSTPSSASSVSSHSDSSSSSSEAPSADLSFGFNEGVDGWYVNGQQPGTLISEQISMAHDLVNKALSITPLNWGADNWRYQARFNFDAEENLSDSRIEYTLSVPQGYITDSGLEFQLIILAVENTSYGGTITMASLGDANDAGDYVIGRDINVAAATGLGFQLAKAPTDSNLKSPILVKSILIKRPEGASSSSSSSAPIEDNNIVLPVDSAWSNDNSPVTITYSNGVSLTPDWSTAATYGYTAMTMLPEAMDLQGASVTYEFTVEESLITGGLALQPFAQQNSGNYSGVWGYNIANTALVAGDNTFTMGPLDGSVTDLQRIGIKLSQSGASNPAGAVVIKSVTIQLP